MSTILIVEDEIELLKALATKLEREGFTALQAQNGQEGLDLALDKHPDLILLDIVMPVMDGLTMLKALRKDAWGAHAQIMLLTNLSSMEKLADAAEYGVKEYIIKSDIKLDDLIIKIREKFRNS